MQAITRAWSAKYPAVLLAAPVIIWFVMAAYGVHTNAETIFGRYQYIGQDTMSIAGYLDLAHYRPLAGEEVLGWQFFFGNIHYLVILALVLAGVFHAFIPKPVGSTTVPTYERLHAGRNGKIMVLAGLSIVAGIITVELLACILDLGPKIFTGQYFRDIPTLVSSGYVPTNCINTHAQVPVSFIPVLAGGVFLPYFLGLKRFHKQGRAARPADPPAPRGLLLLGIGLGYLLLIIAISPTGVQAMLTGYSITMAVAWLLAIMIATGTVLGFQRPALVQAGSTPSRGARQEVASFFKHAGTYVLVLAAVLVAAIAMLLPFTELVGLDITSAPVMLPVVLIPVVTGVLVMTFIVMRKNIPARRASMAFTGLVAGVLAMVVYFVLKGDLMDLEIAWLYNAVLPMVFIAGLTLLFYRLGFHVDRVASRVTRAITRLAARLGRETRAPRLASPVKVAMLAVVVLGAAIPVSIGGAAAGEKMVVVLNQVGMFPEQDKVFFLRSDYDSTSTGTWELLSTDSGSVVATGQLGPAVYKYKKFYRRGDFSSVATEGNYTIRCHVGMHRVASFPFVISRAWFNDIYRTGLYWYYYMRCGTVVHEIVPGYPGHGSCHDHPVFYRENESGTIVVKNDRNLNGRYHDSGDYNCYGHRIAPLTLALPVTYHQAPVFFDLPVNKATYPQDDSIPDIIEEMWHGVQFWANRYHEGYRKFFDSTVLGNHQAIRWTVFGPPEYEDQFGGYNGTPGRWIHDEVNPEDVPDGAPEEYGSVEGQFLLMEHHAPAVIAYMASFINTCDVIGWNPGNRSHLLAIVLDARDAYASRVGANWYGINCELALYNLTGNATYLTNANAFAETIISGAATVLADTASMNGDRYVNIASALDFAERHNASLVLLANTSGVIDAIHHELEARTDPTDNENILRYLRFSRGGVPAYNIGQVFSAMMVACYGYNLTSSTAQRKFFYDFITRSYDFLLGMNPENICMLEGVLGGDNFLFQYHAHRYRFIPGIVRGGCPGFIVDGFERFPGEIGGYDGKLQNEQVKLIEKATNLYSETWSDVQFRFMLLNGAFHRLVLGQG